MSWRAKCQPLQRIRLTDEQKQEIVNKSNERERLATEFELKLRQADTHERKAAELRGEARVMWERRHILSPKRLALSYGVGETTIRKLIRESKT